MTLPRTLAQRSTKPDQPATAPLIALWNDTAPDAYGLNAVIGTAAVALLARGITTDVAGARSEAARLWAERPSLPGSRP
jgi:hypothetical protein